MILHISLLDETHGVSSRSIACLEDTRLERSSELPKARREIMTAFFNHTLNWVRVPKGESLFVRI